MIINALLTRRCNLKCEYCNIVTDRFKEMPAQEWFNFITRMDEFVDHNLFTILYGGEPTLYYDFENLVKLMINSDLEYTIITNATEYAVKKLKPFIKDLKGITASVDPLIFDTKKYDKARFIKSDKGLKFLIDCKKQNPSIDAVAEIVVDKYNYIYLPQLVKTLNDYGIWSSITIIENAKTKDYDFATCRDDQLMSQEDLLELIRMITDLVFIKKTLVHAPEAIYTVALNGSMNSYCKPNLPNGDKNPSMVNDETITVNPDGSLRLCLRIEGDKSTKYTIEDLLVKYKEFDNACQEDYKKLCKGCSWTCTFMFNVIHDSLPHIYGDNK